MLPAVSPSPASAAKSHGKGVAAGLVSNSPTMPSSATVLVRCRRAAASHTTSNVLMLAARVATSGQTKPAPSLTWPIRAMNVPKPTPASSGNRASRGPKPAAESEREMIQMATSASAKPANWARLGNPSVRTPTNSGMPPEATAVSGAATPILPLARLR